MRTPVNPCGFQTYNTPGFGEFLSNIVQFTENWLLYLFIEGFEMFLTCLKCEIVQKKCER